MKNRKLIQGASGLRFVGLRTWPNWIQQSGRHAWIVFESSTFTRSYRALGTGVDTAKTSPFRSLIAKPKAQIPSVCSFSSVANAPFRMLSISARISLIGRRGESRPLVSAAISPAVRAGSMQANAALPFAVVARGNDSPILETARNRWRPTIWSMNNILFPSRMARSTVSPDSSEIRFMTGRSRSFMSDAVA